MSKAGRVTKQKKVLMSKGYSLEQLNAMTAIERSQLITNLGIRGEIENIVKTIPAVIPNPLPVQSQVEELSEEELVEQIKESFEALDDITLATVLGANNALIISGKAGVGKSYGVNKIVKEYAQQASFLTSYVRATGLYKALYESREEGSVLLLDDVDTVFTDETSLNLLKHACDSSDERLIQWGSQADLVDETGEVLPKSFMFKGTVIFITNKDLYTMANSNSKISEHIAAMISRAMYVDVGMRHPREAMAWIRNIVKTTDMLEDLTEEEQEQVLEWIDENKAKLWDLSLRTAKKTAKLLKTSTERWKKLAEKALCKKNSLVA